MCVPFVLTFAVGPWTEVWPRRLRSVVAVCCFASLLIAGRWTRNSLERDAAFWEAAEWVKAQGVAPIDVAATWSWNSYGGAFDQWIAQSTKNGSPVPKWVIERYPAFLDANAARRVYRRGRSARRR